MKNCFECKHGCIKFENDAKGDKTFALLEENKESVLGNMYGKCTNGNTDRLVMHYKQYGNQPKAMAEGIELDCHDYSDGIKILDNCIDIVDKLLQEIQNE